MTKLNTTSKNASVKTMLTLGIPPQHVFATTVIDYVCFRLVKNKGEGSINLGACKDYLINSGFTIEQVIAFLPSIKQYFNEDEWQLGRLVLRLPEEAKVEVPMNVKQEVKQEVPMNVKQEEVNPFFNFVELEEAQSIDFDNFIPQPEAASVSSSEWPTF